MSADEPPESELLIPNEELPSFLNPSTASWFTEDPHLYKLYKKHLPLIPFYYRYFPVERIDWPKIEHYLSQGFTLRDLLRFSVHNADQYLCVFTIQQSEILSVLFLWTVTSSVIFGPLDGFTVMLFTLFYILIFFPWTHLIAFEYRKNYLFRLSNNSTYSLLKTLSLKKNGSEASLVKEAFRQFYIITLRVTIPIVFILMVIFFIFLCFINIYAVLIIFLLPILYGAYMNHIANISTEEKKYSIEHEFNNSLEDYLLLLECYKSKYRDQNDNWYSGYEEKLVQIINSSPRLTNAERQKLLHIIRKN